jgi:hypothetical protein
MKGIFNFYMKNIFYKTAIVCATFLSTLFLVTGINKTKNKVQVIEFKNEMLILPPTQFITFEDAMVIKSNKDQ